MPINLEYTGAECPDCSEPIEDDKESGDSCENCGHVFFEMKEVDDIPDDEDVTTSDRQTFFYCGKKIVDISMAEYDDDTDAGLKAVAKWMKKEGYFPNVWFISDHGNPILQSVSEFL